MKLSDEGYSNMMILSISSDRLLCTEDNLRRVLDNIYSFFYSIHQGKSLYGLTYQNGTQSPCYSIIKNSEEQIENEDGLEEIEMYLFNTKDNGEVKNWARVAKYIISNFFNIKLKNDNDDDNDDENQD